MTIYYAVDKGLWAGRCVRFSSLPSTNTWAIEHLAELQEGFIVRAETQTAGRGRFERNWFSVPGKALTLSLVLKDQGWIPFGANLGQAAALAVSDLLAGYGIQAQLKWPNDVMVNDRKVCGILVERGATGEGFVVGIGLNVNISTEEFTQAALERPATSLAEAAARAFDLEAVQESLRLALMRWLEALRDRGVTPLWEEWSARDWLRGRTIEIRGMAGDRTVGDYLGLSAEGGVRLRTQEGDERVFWSGDVERVLVG